MDDGNRGRTRYASRMLSNLGADRWVGPDGDDVSPSTFLLSVKVSAA
jgi:hypothetical protein